jgi:hypothetical protein
VKFIINQGMFKLGLGLGLQALRRPRGDEDEGTCAPNDAPCDVKCLFVPFFFFWSCFYHFCALIFAVFVCAIACFSLCNKCTSARADTFFRRKTLIHYEAFLRLSETLQLKCPF